MAKYKVKIYLESGQVAEVITQAKNAESGVGKDLLLDIPEVRSFDYTKILLVTSECLEG